MRKVFRTFSTLPALLPDCTALLDAGPLRALGRALIPSAATPLPLFAPEGAGADGPPLGRDLSAVRAGEKVRACRFCNLRAFAFRPPRAAGSALLSGAIFHPG